MKTKQVFRKVIKRVAGTAVVATLIAAPAALFGQNYEPNETVFEQDTVVVPEQAQQDQPTQIDEGSTAVQQDQQNADQDSVLIEEQDTQALPSDQGLDQSQAIPQEENTTEDIGLINFAQDVSVTTGHDDHAEHGDAIHEQEHVDQDHAVDQADHDQAQDIDQSTDQVQTPDQGQIQSPQNQTGQGADLNATW